MRMKSASQPSCLASKQYEIIERERGNVKSSEDDNEGRQEERLVGCYFLSLGDYSFISPHKCVNKKDYHSLGDLTRCKEFSLLNFSTYP